MMNINMEELTDDKASINQEPSSTVMRAVGASTPKKMVQESGHQSSQY
jgi:hypothetical protein